MNFLAISLSVNIEFLGIVTGTKSDIMRSYFKQQFCLAFSSWAKSNMITGGKEVCELPEMRVFLVAEDDRSFFNAELVADAATTSCNCF